MSSLRLSLLVVLLGLTGACTAHGPELVVEQAVSAARDGDREAFLACFTPRSRAILQVWWRATDEHNPPLGALAARDVRITSTRLIPSRDFEPMRAIIELEEGPDSTRIVAHYMAGMWRLDVLDSQHADLVGASHRR